MLIPIRIQAYTFVVAMSLQDASLSLSSTYSTVRLRPYRMLRYRLLAAASVSILNSNRY